MKSNRLNNEAHEAAESSAEATVKKPFFKSVAFKCIVTLLCVLLISGIFLTIAYGFLEVTDEERFNRKVGKLYTDGTKITTENQEIEETAVGDSKIEKLWKIPEKSDYLVQVSSQGRDGPIVTWVIVDMSEDFTKIDGIGTVLVYNKVASEYADKIPGWNSNIANFSEDYTAGIEYNYGTDGDPMYINTGASKSFTAICACVNDAITYINSIIGGGSGGETTNVYENFAYTKYINTTKTTHEFKDGAIVYSIVTKNSGLEPNAYTFTIKVGTDGTVTDYAVVKSGAYADDKNYPALEITEEAMRNILVGKNAQEILAILAPSGDEPKYSDLKDQGGVVYTGATQSNFLKLYAALFATSNYKLAVATCPFSYTKYINTGKTTYTADAGVVTYTIVTKNTGLEPNAYTFTIKVGADGTVTDYAVVKSGAYADDKNYPALEITEEAMRNILVGKSAQEILAILAPSGDEPKYSDLKDQGGVVYTGATQSNFLKLYAALYATSNYGLAVLTGGNVNE